MDAAHTLGGPGSTGGSGAFERLGRPPRIVITYPYPLGNPVAGGSRTTPEVARHLAALGAEVLILPVSTNALDRRVPRQPVAPSELGHHLDAGLAAQGVRIVRVPQHPAHQFLDGLAVRDAVARLLSEGPVDGVIGHMHEAGALVNLCRAHGIPFTFLATWQTYSRCQEHFGGLVGRLRMHTERRMIVEAHRRADRIFAISDFTRRELVDLLGVRPERIELCPLGVDPSFGAVERPAREGVKRLLFFGRIIVWKGFQDALQALAELDRRGVGDWTYRMVGFGHKQRALDMAAELGIGDRVEVLDPVDDAGLKEQLAWADLALMPSHFESFGLSIAEAQAAGLPVVAYAVGSVPEVVRDGTTGWLAPFQEVEGLADRLEQAVRDSEETARRGAAARAWAREHFSWPGTARILWDGLSELAAQRGESASAGSSSSPST